MTQPSDLWAPFALRVKCGRLDLRAITDGDIGPLVDLVREGLHDPAEMPFSYPWTDAPAEDLPRNTAAYYWRSRAGFGPDDWILDLAVRLDGELVGVQGMRATNYSVVRSGETGSWLGRRFQGRGIGTWMRQVFCAFVFDYLDGEEITSAAFRDNPASLAVSRKVGYVSNGVSREQRRPGELVISEKLVLTPDRLVRRSEPLVVTGVEPLRRAIGLSN
jgi:RimJ/RimL family protein N-acetyltransferase